MSLNNQRELTNTREKLQLLQSLHAEASAQSEGDPEVRQAELDRCNDKSSNSRKK